MDSLSRARSLLIARLHRRRTREREHRVLVEGPRAVREVRARLAGAPLPSSTDAPWYVISPRLDEIDPALAQLLSEADCTRVDDAELAALAGTDAPQGVLMVVPEPAVAPRDLFRAGAHLLLLDGVQDPGNVGTLVRSAAAFGLDGVVALDGSADPWSPKAVRSAAGTTFHLPVATATWHDVAHMVAASGVPLLVADAEGSDPGTAGGDRAGWALVVGSEGSGVRPDVAHAAAARVAIPMQGGVESLNAGVAGSILLYALRHPRS